MADGDVKQNTRNGGNTLSGSSENTRHPKTAVLVSITKAAFNIAPDTPNPRNKVSAHHPFRAAQRCIVYLPDLSTIGSFKLRQANSPLGPARYT